MSISLPTTSFEMRLFVPESTNDLFVTKERNSEIYQLGFDSKPGKGQG